MNGNMVPMFSLDFLLQSWCLLLLLVLLAVGMLWGWFNS